MEIIPAIDIKGGKCVRLYQGDYSKETVFFDDPVPVARKWQSMGAKRLHIVDLDGAATGKPQNIKIADSIIKGVGLPVQLGGGIRTKSVVKKLIDMGVNRVILGTSAIEKPGLIRELCREYGDAVIVSIDARDGFVAVRGWVKSTSVKAIDLALKMEEAGVRRIMFTDIKRDGTLTEPSFDSISNLINSVKIPVIAAGGISRLSHLKKLAGIGVEGAILGRALYTEDIDLKEAIAQFA